VYLDEEKKSKDQVLARKSGHTLPPLPTAAYYCWVIYSQVKKPAADKNGRLAFLNKNLKVPIRSSSRWSFSAVLFE
jgi:hypothetical protein